MANWSDTTVTIASQNIFTISEPHNKFQTTWQYEFFSVGHIETPDPYTLIVSGKGRWSAEIYDLANELLEFPDIDSAQLVDSESGNDFFYMIKIQDNKITYDKLSDYLSQ